MTYERDRLNRTVAENDVVIKKSSLTAMTIGLIAMAAIILGLAWQNYQQQERIDYLSNSNLRTTTVSQQSTTQPSQPPQ